MNENTLSEKNKSRATRLATNKRKQKNQPIHRESRWK
jgi:hypothetical protein